MSETPGSVPRRPRDLLGHLVGGDLLVVDPRVVLPRRRDELREGLRDAHLGAHEELERVVEERRVGARAVECRGERLVEPARVLARLHPGDVALDRVDLAVVAEEGRKGCARSQLGSVFVEKR